MAEQVYQVALNAAEDNPALALSAADADNAITMTSGPGDAVSAEAAEAWAVGTRNGVPVQSGDATYENSSKYWAGQAKHSQEYANASYLQARAYANGTAGEYTITNDNGTSYRVPVDVGYEDLTLPNGGIMRITKSAEGYASKAKKYAEIAAQYGNSNATADGLTKVVTEVTYSASNAQMQNKGFKVTTKEGNNTATTTLVNLLELKQDMGLGGALIYTDKGVAGGLATLDAAGKVPASQLPSYVDDVEEYANLAAFPETGEGGKIYVAQDTGKVYRWASTEYVIISDYVHPAYTARTGKPTGNQTPGFGGSFQISQVTSDSSGHVTGMTDRTVTIPNAAATSSAAGLMSAADKAKLDNIAPSAAAIDDTAGDGDTGSTYSADKIVDLLALKADKTDTVLNTTLSRGRKNGTTAGTGSFAFGYSVTSSGSYSHAEGNATATGQYAHAEGQGNASQVNAHAEGAATASGTNSHAEGLNSTASGSASHAEGAFATASAQNAHAEGMETTASGDKSHAEGWGTTANHRSQHVFGEYNELDPSAATSDNRGNYVEIVGKGTSNSVRSNARTLDWSGNETLAGKLTLGAAPTANMDAATKQYVDTAVTNKTEIDDTAGDGDTDVTWSADKLVDECFAVTTGAITSLPMTITDARITEECVVLDEMIDQQVDIGWVTTAGKLILYGTLPTGTTIASKKIKVKRCHGLTEDAVTLSIRFQTSTSANGNYLVVDAGNLLPGTQYSWYLYKVVSGTETQVSGIGSTTSYPTASRWYQEATYNLEDGVTYKAKIWPTAQSSNVTTSGTVTFTAALTS